MNKPRSQMNKLLADTCNGTLFIPKTKTEEKMKVLVKLIARNIYSDK